jgi:PAS domain S-box-containing protein/putative nucleotidyltransferase with HDIG domain
MQEKHKEQIKELEARIQSLEDENQLLRERINTSEISHRNGEEDRQENDKNFRQAIFEAPFPIMIHAEDGEVITVNKVWMELTGYSSESLVTVSDWTSRAYGNNHSRVKEDIDKLYDLNGRQDEGRYTITTQEGSQRIWDFGSAPFGRTKDGRRLVISVAKDITDQVMAEAEIQNLRAFNEDILQNMTEGIVVQNTKGEFTFVNPATAHILGYDPAEIIGKHWKKFVPIDQHPIIEEADQRRMEGKADRYGIEVLAKGGKRIPVQVSGCPRKDSASGEFIGTLAVFTDISEREEAERTLRLTQFSIDHIADAAFWVGSDARFTYVNEATCRSLGYSREELLTMTVHDIDPDFPEEVWPEHWQEVRERGSFTIESHHRTKDGHVFPVEIKVSYLEFQGKEYDCAFAHNITERKKYEQAIENNERFLSNVFDAIQDGISVLDKDLNILRVNNTMEEWYRHNMPLVGKKCFQAYHGRDEVCDNCPTVPVFSDKKPHMTVVPLMGAEESRGWLELYSFPVSDHSGEAINVVEYVRNISERKLAEEQTQTQMQRLAALRRIDMAITTNLEIQVTLSVLLEQALMNLEVDAAAVLLLNSQELALEFAAGRGFRTPAIKNTRLRLGYNFASRAALSREIVGVPHKNRHDKTFLDGSPFAEEEFVAYYGVPLIAKGEVKGVLEIFHRSPLDPTPDWLDFLKSLAGQAAIAIDNASLFDNLQQSHRELSRAYHNTLEGWAHALELRDFETKGHSQRVTDMTLRIARAVGVSEENQVHIRRGALLHDIGKMGIPDSILLKPGPLSSKEWEIMRQHPIYAYEMLASIDYLRPAIDIPYAHHEKWDGTGYPRGLKGEAIPMAARIFAIVDVWDALLSERPYRVAWPEEDVLDYIRSQAGRHFDPRLVETFLVVFNRN